MEENDPRLNAIWQSLRKAEKENPLSSYAFETRLMARLKSEHEQTPFFFWAARVAPALMLASIVLAWGLSEEIGQFEDAAVIQVAGDPFPVLKSTGDNL